jgi:hypothetical protein
MPFPSRVSTWHPLKADFSPRCCQIHDKCYSEYDAKWQADCTWIPFSGSHYIKTYTYTCDSTMNCHADQNKPCEQFLCECDKLVSHNSKYSTIFNYFRFFRKVIDCLLKQPAPTEMKECPWTNEWMLKRINWVLKKAIKIIKITNDMIFYYSNFY